MPSLPLEPVNDAAVWVAGVVGVRVNSSLTSNIFLGTLVVEIAGSMIESLGVEGASNTSCPISSTTLTPRNGLKVVVVWIEGLSSLVVETAL